MCFWEEREAWRNSLLLFNTGRGRTSRGWKDTALAGPGYEALRVNSGAADQDLVSRKRLHQRTRLKCC